MAGIPRLYAAASLKHIRAHIVVGCCAGGIPRLYAAASLKQPRGAVRALRVHVYSAALCRGLIEAHVRREKPLERSNGIPRLYAAASLKHRNRVAERHVARRYSAALCRGLIEATEGSAPLPAWVPYSAALCRGLIEAAIATLTRCSRMMCIPRLYAAASLKHLVIHAACDAALAYSAALCRGLIEAGYGGLGRRPGDSVFRGFMPRPH